MPFLVTDGQLADRETFASLLAQTFEPTEIIELLYAMGLRYEDLALALGVHPRTIRAWVSDSDDRNGKRQRDEIQSLKAVVLFMLRRGVLKPRQLALWLAEPNEGLGFRRPLAVFGDGDINETLSPLVNAAAPFLRGEPAVALLPQRGTAEGTIARKRAREDGLPPQTDSTVSGVKNSERPEANEPAGPPQGPAVRGVESSDSERPEANEPAGPPQRPAVRGVESSDSERPEANEPAGPPQRPAVRGVESSDSERPEAKEPAAPPQRT